MAQVFEGLGVAGLGLGWWVTVHRCGNRFVEGVDMNPQAIQIMLLLGFGAAFGFIIGWVLAMLWGKKK